jgi:Outer membrane protein beta-barrel domain
LRQNPTWPAGSDFSSVAFDRGICRGAAVRYRLFQAALCRQVLVMLCPVVDVFARHTRAIVGCAVVFIYLVDVGVCCAQTQTSSVNLSTVNVPPVTVPKVNVPRITVPSISVQVRTASTRTGPGSATTIASSAASASDESEGENGDPEESQSDFPPSVIPRLTGSHIGTTPPAAGSLLQLISACEPADPTMGPSFPAPPPERLPGTDLQRGLQWTNPYETAPASGDVRTGWYRYTPLGMFPWGPRTPLALRAAGWGEPLLGTSWLNRPWSASWFAGGIFGSPLMHGVSQQGGFYGGYRLGWDYDFYWGLEGRVGASSISLFVPDRIGGQPGTNDFWNLDLNLHWYPWGDARWRPYASFGIGLANFAFYDAFNNRYDQVQFSTPIGVGLKYRWTNWVAFRADLMDNIAYARGPVDTVNYFSFTLGVEMQFGGVRRTYWPWNPSKIIR